MHAYDIGQFYLIANALGYSATEMKKANLEAFCVYLFFRGKGFNFLPFSVDVC
jgi:hypothetical protein